MFYTSKKLFWYLNRNKIPFKKITFTGHSAKPPFLIYANEVLQNILI